MLGCVVVGEAGGADAGTVVEGWDFEAGVVGENEEAGSGEGVGDGFEVGVALEGGGVFDGLGDLMEVGEGENFYAGDAGACGELGELAGVGGCGVERQRWHQGEHTSGPTPFWVCVQANIAVTALDKNCGRGIRHRESL